MAQLQATIFTLALLGVAAAAQAADVTGVVRDSTGAVVQAATVIVRPATGPEHQLLTGPDGTFTVDVASPGNITIVVRAGGFAELSKTVPEADRPRSIDIVLAPAGILEALTVTAARGSVESDTPAATTVLTAETLRASPAAMLDDQLKSVPGFSLFRRTSSRVANPTTQGLTMRGLSASGASRGLVLVDGVPLNDPFGNWVYWNRIPQAAVERVEVVRGGTATCGADAVGGVVRSDLAQTRPTAHGRVWIAQHAAPVGAGAAPATTGAGSAPPVAGFRRLHSGEEAQRGHRCRRTANTPPATAANRLGQTRGVRAARGSAFNGRAATARR